jgi:hypothetical protein
MATDRYVRLREEDCYKLSVCVFCYQKDCTPHAKGCPLAAALAAPQNSVTHCDHPDHVNSQAGICMDCGRAASAPASGLEAKNLAAEMPPIVDTGQGRWLELHTPFRKELTVIMRPDTSPHEADKDVDAVKNGQSQILRFGVAENYFHQLRLRTSQDPALLENIAVFLLKDNQYVPIELTFDGEIRWPREFLSEGLNIEMAIARVRRCPWCKDRVPLRGAFHVTRPDEGGECLVRCPFLALSQSAPQPDKGNPFYNDRRADSAPAPGEKTNG